jgi:tRNA pseudouridine55 synthase
MNTILNIYKPVGTTPLELIHAVKETYPEYIDQKIGYAGRLDPLAHGVMLLMVGDATKDRDSYLNLEKHYVFEVLFGIATDTYDVLGKITQKISSNIIVMENVEKFVNVHVGKQTQAYPPYSSKAVHGKPLFWWARKNKLSEITIPKHDIDVTSFDLLEYNEISLKVLKKRIFTNIALIQGDFRQDEIVRNWHDQFASTKLISFQTAKFSIVCSSGSYVRGIVHDLGKELGSGAVTLDILRTKVGEYDLNGSIKL